MFAVTDDLILSDMSQAHRACMRQDRLPLHSPDACQVRPDPAAKPQPIENDSGQRPRAVPQKQMRHVDPRVQLQGLTLRSLIGSRPAEGARRSRHSACTRHSEQQDTDSLARQSSSCNMLFRQTGSAQKLRRIPAE